MDTSSPFEDGIVVEFDHLFPVTVDNAPALTR